MLRRTFLSQTAPAAVLASAANRVRLGLIGAGARGLVLMREFTRLGGVEFVAVADVFDQRHDEARAIAPGIAAYRDARSLLDRKDIDAVLIATPQHLHAEGFLAAIAAGRDVYLEKTMAFTIPQLKRMRAAARASDRVIQIGNQACSSVQMADAVRLADGGRLGRITKIHATQYRNTPHGKPQWRRPIPARATPAQIDWKAFLGEAPARDFDAERFINWRLYWDYSGGNVFENMVHQVTFWYKALNLAIPRAVTMTGDIYLWKDGREVPDTMEVSLKQPEGFLFVWSSGFGNDYPGEREEVLGDEGTLVRGESLRYLPQQATRPGEKPVEASPEDAPTPAHARNFLECVRSRRQPNAPLELAFRATVACQMAVASYRLGRTVSWDSVREEIV